MSIRKSWKAFSRTRITNRNINTNIDVTTERHELIKQHIDSFPILPTTVTKLMKVTNDPEGSAQDVMETILPDQSLCLTILKIANSVLFGRPQSVDSITLAVAVLGFNEIQNIALTKAVINSFRKLSPEQKPFVDKFWEHSFVCGIAARLIAQDLHLALDVAFAGGLIHDIGKLIMLETFSEDYEVGLWLTTFGDEKMLHNEFKTFGFGHEMVASQLLRKWFFPENLVAIVANHHCPSNAVEDRELAYVIQLADILSFYCCNQELLDEDNILAAINSGLPGMQSQWQNLGLSANDDAICGWFNWLLDSYEQNCDLKEAFST